MQPMSSNRNLPVCQNGNGQEDKLNGYPSYPSKEDIYRKYKEEKNINPEDISKIKEPVQKAKTAASRDEDIQDDESGNDLDVPGSELDDPEEEIGNEDEENNYYSLGGDEHSDLDENQGE
jgi:hypothetical protein